MTIKYDSRFKRRFWSKVNKFSGECWLWTGAIAGSGCGYGYFNDGQGRTVRAHRLVWELTYGPIPPGLRVLHTCDNSWCQAPHHLFLGTDSDNRNDSKTKGRTSHLFGNNSGRAKVSEEQVREIRRLYKPWKMSHRKLGKMFGLSHTAIDHILQRKNWPHVE